MAKGSMMMPLVLIGGVAAIILLSKKKKDTTQEMPDLSPEQLAGMGEALEQAAADAAAAEFGPFRPE